MRSLLIVGTLLFLSFSSQAQMASIQMIHASADTSLSQVDIWLDNLKIADDIGFNQATSKIQLPTNQSFEIRVSTASSMDTTSPLVIITDSITMQGNFAYMLAGLSTPTGYSNFQPLSITAIGTFQDVANVSGNTAFKYVNAATDLGIVTIAENKEGLGNLISEVQYSQYSSFEEQTTSNFRFTLESNSAVVIREFDVAMANEGLQDSSLIIFNTGFKDPKLNNDGSALNLIGVLPSGTVVHFPQSLARLQFIHNSADPSIFRVDIYIDGTKTADDFQFRAASGRLSIPSGRTMEIAIAPDSSTDVGDAFYILDTNFSADESYVAITAGNATSGFSPEKSFELFIRSARPEALIGSNVDVMFFNGATDAGEISIYETSAIEANIFAPRNFGEFDNYTSLPYTDYKLDMISEVNNSILAKYDFILSLYNLEGEAITLMTSGYLDSAANKNGPPMSLWFARPQSGLMIELPLAVGIKETVEPATEVRLFPQPAGDELIVEGNVSFVHCEVYSLHGQAIYHKTIDDPTIRITTSGLASGTYFIVLKHDEGVIRKKFQIRH